MIKRAKEIDEYGNIIWEKIAENTTKVHYSYTVPADYQDGELIVNDNAISNSTESLYYGLSRVDDVLELDSALSGTISACRSYKYGNMALLCVTFDGVVATRGQKIATLKEDWRPSEYAVQNPGICFYEVDEGSPPGSYYSYCRVVPDGGVYQSLTPDGRTFHIYIMYPLS